MRYRCDSHKALPADHCTGQPFARWYFPDGVGATLCKISLDFWLDNADDDPEMEPARLVFLTV